MPLSEGYLTIVFSENTPFRVLDFLEAETQKENVSLDCYIQNMIESKMRMEENASSKTNS